MNTIDTILKIAKVKDMDSFYKKFPSEEAFMAKYGKEFKKAMKGAKIPKAQDGFDISDKFTMNMNDWFENQHIGLSKEDQLKLNSAQFKPFQKMDFMSGNMQTSTNNKGLNLDFSNLSLGSGLGAAQDLIEGIQMLKQQKEEKNRAEQWRDVTNIQLQASNLKPERLENKYLRPEDNVITGEQYFPTYGTGAGVLAKNGIYIKPSKRGTFTAAAKKRGKGVQEFASQILANKSNYSPAMVKKANFARNASKWKKAEDGTTIDPWTMGGDVASNLLTSVMGEDGGGKIGGAIGGTAGTLIGGPIGGAIGKVGGQLIGSLVDTTDDKIENYKKQTGRNINLMMANAGAQGIHNMYSGYMEDGGLMEANDLIPLEGGIRSISYNPFIGETSQLEGPPHERGGMMVAKASEGMNIPDANIVEAEGGETSTNMKDGSSVIFGDLYAPGYGKKFKNVSKDIAKKEEKQNKIIEKSAKELELLDIQTPLDKLKLKTLETNIKGATMKQQELAGEREHLIALQEAINQTADDMNIDAGALSQGKIKKAKKNSTAKYGTKIKAEGGDRLYSDDRNRLERIQDRVYGYYNAYKPQLFKDFPILDPYEFGLQYITGNTPDTGMQTGMPGHIGGFRKGNLGQQSVKGVRQSFTGNIPKQTFTPTGKASRPVSTPTHAVGTNRPTGLTSSAPGVTPNQITNIPLPKTNAAKFDRALEKAQMQGRIEHVNQINRLKSKVDKGKRLAREEQKLLDELAATPSGSNIPKDLHGTVDFVSPTKKIPWGDIGLGAAAAGTLGLGIYGLMRGEDEEGNERGYTTYPNRTIPDFNQRYDFYPPYDGQEEQEFLYEYPDDDLVGTNILPEVNITANTSPTGQSSYSTPEGWTKEQIVALQKELNNKGNNIAVDGIWGPETEAAFNRTKGMVVAPEVELEELSAIEDPEMVATKDPVLAVNDVQEKDNSDLWKSMLSLVPRFMPSDVEGLDPSQIAGELATLSDRPEPVWAQTIQPDLSSPYEISLQDQKNEVIAQSRAAQRMAGNNPAAQAMIAAQTSDALNKIQGEEFRFNQAMKDKVFAENRNLMNQTKLQNLEFLDRLYTRQEQAKSNTKENLRNALSSIGDKYMKNRFENKTLAAYENLYNYRFDKKGRAWYMGSPTSLDMEGSGGQHASGQYDPDYIPRYERDPETGRERVVGTRRRTKDEKVTARNGAIVKALKRI